MSVIALIATKGGAGKSTIAVHLAVAAAMKGRKPLLMDFDKKQLSVLLWGKGLRKKAKKPAIQKGVIETLGEDLVQARRKHDLIIIDVGAGGGDEVRNIATLAEHILVPVRASAFDVSGTRDAINLLRECADNTEPEELAYKNALGKAAIVLNGTPRRPSARWREDLEEALRSCGAGTLPVVGALSDRPAYAEAIESGLGVTEDADDETAVSEILDLYKGVVALEAERRRKIKPERR